MGDHLTNLTDLSKLPSPKKLVAIKISASTKLFSNLSHHSFVKEKICIINLSALSALKNPLATADKLSVFDRFVGLVLKGLTFFFPDCHNAFLLSFYIMT